MIAQGKSPWIPPELEQCPVFLEDTLLVRNWNASVRKWQRLFPDVNLAVQVRMAHNRASERKFERKERGKRWKPFLTAWFRHEQERIYRASQSNKDDWIRQVAHG